MLNRLTYRKNHTRLWSRVKNILLIPIIVSTGAESIWLNAPGEAEQKGRGISTCATCDGAFLEMKKF